MTTFLYRDRLTRAELLPALGAGVGAGVAVAVTVTYLTQLMLRRRELESAPSAPRAAERRVEERG